MTSEFVIEGGTYVLVGEGHSLLSYEKPKLYFHISTKHLVVENWFNGSYISPVNTPYLPLKLNDRNQFKVKEITFQAQFNKRALEFALGQLQRSCSRY